MDPADGILYAATHYGLFRLPEGGDPVRVADRYQDTMGFTVTGPNTFLGSGHPDFVADPDLPTRLGLIRSDDGGESWEIVSLGGVADFHALHSAHGLVYGWDSGTGRFMVSADDGGAWEVRSTLEMFDFAVSPTDPERLLASTTTEGLLRSIDGGRTWQPITGAPAVAVLSWPSQDSVFGVTTDGSVQHSVDGGASWESRGAVGGKPEALLADERGSELMLYVAVSGRGILASADGGQEFTTRYAD
ncbi:MAG: hypothetical protein M3381_12930 [Actinomycetota bacterium]|nr:hypothetical protein [Actinomycetota bacterium]